MYSVSFVVLFVMPLAACSLAWSAVPGGCISGYGRSAESVMLHKSQSKALQQQQEEEEEVKYVCWVPEIER